MVLLSDKTTGVAIPYSSVWATVTKDGKARLRRAAVADGLPLHGAALWQQRRVAGAGVYN